MTNIAITTARFKFWIAVSTFRLATLAVAAEPPPTAPPPILQEWSSPIPCDEQHSHPLPGQPALGLALFRFDCPGLPSRLVGAKRMTRLPAIFSNEDIPRGNAPRKAAVQQGPDTAVYRRTDKPLEIAGMEKMQARRFIPAGEKLLFKDFEPKKIWTGGDAITLKIVNGSVVATLPAQALGVGRHGEAATAKTEAGKTFTGTAIEDEQGPVLLVGHPQR